VSGTLKQNAPNLDAYWMPLTANRRLKRLREIATRHGTVFIFDEMITGFRSPGAVCSIGLVPGIEPGSRRGSISSRAYDVCVDCFKQDLSARVTGDIIALSPPLIIEREHIDTIVRPSDALTRVVPTRMPAGGEVTLCVGVPKEIEVQQYRVDLNLGAVREYVAVSHTVLVETKRGRD
jgi:acetylornithine/succinyldiaminopimelate/putrescine aminotransferase